MKRRILAALIALSWAGAVLAGNGGEPFAFMKNGIGARSTGMGGAFTSVSDDLSGVFYNPAGLVRLRDLQFAAETYIMSFGRSINYISTGKPFTISDNTYTTAVSWINYNSGDDIEARHTNSEEPDSTFSNDANIFIFSTATCLAKNWYMGGSFKFLFQNISDSRGSGVGFDLGTALVIIDNINLGLALKNLSTNVSWNNSSYIEAVPMVISGGLSYRYINMLNVEELDIWPSIDIVYTSDYEQTRIKFGTELSANDFMFVRGGFDGKTVTMGAGIRLKPSKLFSININYSFLNDIILTDVFNNRIGVTLDYIFPHWGKRVEDEYNNGNGESGIGNSEKSKSNTKTQEAKEKSVKDDPDEYNW